MFSPAGNTNPNDFSEAEKTLFRRVFVETLDKQIPALIYDLYDSRLVLFHPLPEMKGSTRLQLIGKETVILTVDEFADYKNLPKTLDLDVIIKSVEELAEEAASSYAWNFRNAFIKGGKLRLLFNNGERLHVTDWVDGFRVNIVRPSEGCCPGDLCPGWVSYRYRFAAAKLSI
jgi:hypothetical protein